MSELEPLPPDLGALFADEREAYADDAAARARVMRRLEAAIAFGAVGAVAGGVAVAAKTGFFASLAAHAAKHAKLWIALAFACGIVVGETHARLATQPPPPPVAASSSHATRVEPPPLPPLTPASNEVPAVSVSSLPASPRAPAAAPPVTSAAKATSSDLAAEQALIDTARSALARGRAGDALSAADDHARKYPRGRLAEERETMAIQALLLAGRRSDAEARGQRFHRTYPGSLYGNAVDALLAPKEDGGR
ncbi:MAG: hypothetical protein JWP87_6107 [Labilithrix sp.]|nr:hypothetical protein [Labilithrix sp.]